jgi:hypothetical protein
MTANEIVPKIKKMPECKGLEVEVIRNGRMISVYGFHMAADPQKAKESLEALGFRIMPNTASLKIEEQQEEAPRQWTGREIMALTLRGLSDENSPYPSPELIEAAIAQGYAAKTSYGAYYVTAAGREFLKI